MDRVYIGTIYLDYTGRRVDWIRVSNGVVVDYGMSPPPEDAEVVALKGVLIPGFIDGHTHIFRYGLSLMWIDLRGVESIAELKDRVREGMDRRFMGWILGRGWDQDKMVDGRYPNRLDLDDVSRDIPIYLKRVCGHIAVANSKALEIAGIDVDTEDPPGGLIDRDEDGVPTGVLRETAMALVERHIPEPDTNTLMEAGIRGFEDVLRRGVTMVHLVSATPEEWRVLKLMKSEGRLNVRVRVYLDHRYLEWAVDSGLKMGDGDDMLRFMGIKIITDGSLGGRTAYLRKPYSDDTGNRGVEVVPLEELRRIVKDAFTNGFQLAIHGIGDGAIDNILTALEEEVGMDVASRRDRIEHASIMPSDLIDRASRLGVHISTQPQFVTSDTWVVERLGRERSRYTYPLKTLIDSGLNVGFGSDCPVEVPDPREGIYAAVTRGVGEGNELGLLTPGEKLSISEALRGYTIGASMMSHDDNIGMLEKGSPFDAVELSVDPFKSDPEDILHSRIYRVFVNGVIRFSTLDE